MSFNPFPGLQPTTKKKPPAKKPAAKKNGQPADINLGPIPTPPASSGAKGSQWQQFITYWSSHGYSNLKGQTAQSIFLAAKAEHIDPIVFASLILNESGAHADVKDSKTGAIGIGQLEPSTFIGPHAWNGGVLPWNPKHQITVADLRDPGINMRLAAAYYGYLQGQYPTDAYGRYNASPNAPDSYAGQIQTAFWNKWIGKWNPKYQSTSPTSPAGKAGVQVPGGTAPQTPDLAFKDPYVAGVNKQGKLSTTFDPNKGLQYDGVPLTRSQFLQLKDQLTSTYVSYTGGRPSDKQIATYIQKGWNPYTLTQLLSKGPNFTKSPIYKEYATQFSAATKDLLPKGGKVPEDLARQAILNHWDATTVAAKLRQLPSYTQSEEFKGNVATFQNVHDSIMGSIDAQGLQSVQEAALAGWTTDQYAQWLRSQPNYKYSPEYQSRSLSLLGALGLITGDQAVLKPGAGTGPGYQPSSGDVLPNDPRGIVPYSSPGSQARSGHIPPNPANELGATL